MKRLRDDGLSYFEIAKIVDRNPDVVRVNLAAVLKNLHKLQMIYLPPTLRKFSTDIMLLILTLLMNLYVRYAVSVV